jgi:hypothetical protein
MSFSAITGIVFTPQSLNAFNALDICEQEVRMPIFVFPKSVKYLFKMIEVKKVFSIVKVEHFSRIKEFSGIPFSIND